MNYYELMKAAAIAGSGGGTPTPPPVLIEKSVTQNGTYSAEEDDADGYSAVTVNVPTGGESQPVNDVNFRDYDGTIVASYSAADFAELAALPENPTHDGLTAQGWNWALSDAKTYVAAHGKLEIGQMYTTADGKTRIYIELTDGRLEPVLGLGVNGSVDIDWVDGSEHETLTGTDTGVYVSTSPHTYPAAGKYVIALTITGAAQFLANNKACGLLMKNGSNANDSKCYANAIEKICIGNNMSSSGSSALMNCNSLSAVTIPDGARNIWSNVFQNCNSLRAVTIPDSVTSIGDGAFSGCSSLRSVSIPRSVTSIGNYTFYSCSSLAFITIPDSVTSIGAYAFQNCNALSAVTIPDSVTDIAIYAFSGCYGLAKIIFCSDTPPTVSDPSAFSGIPTDCKIYVPAGSLSAYTSAQNYPDSSTYTYIEY